MRTRQVATFNRCMHTSQNQPTSGGGGGQRGSGKLRENDDSLNVVEISGPVTLQFKDLEIINRPQTAKRFSID